MTIKEDLKNRIPRVRRAMWASPKCYLRFPLLKDGMHGPWMELYDEDIQKDVLKERPGEHKILVVLSHTENDFGAYTGPISDFEKHEENFAKSYLEE